METEQTSRSNKEQILSAFQRLLAERKHIASNIATKQETAERKEDKNIVENASAYTIERIVKGLADLQLHFGSAVDKLTAQLAVEAPKLQELQRAIRVETQHLKELRDIRVAADVLDILIQEHQETMKVFEEKSRQERCAFDDGSVAERRKWEKGHKDFDAALQARQELQEKEREQQEADYQYELERQHKIEADEYANRKMLLERRIAGDEAKKLSNWAAREKLLAEQQTPLQQYKILVESYPQEMEAAIQKSREAAIHEITEAARVQAALFEKELEADKEVAELKIRSLQAAIDKQSVQLEQLSSQLHTSLKQVQELAARAVESTGQLEGRR